VAYGGFLGGLLGSIIYLYRNGFSLWKWADAAVPALGSGLMITRLGCYMYGYDFGKPLSPHAPRWLKFLGTFPHWADGHGAPAWQQHVRLVGFAFQFGEHDRRKNVESRKVRKIPKPSVPDFQLSP
jgi:phosphatidylglycerol:prolipoprotein diacylglycerol transferase